MRQVFSKKISLILAAALCFVATLSMAFALLNTGVETAAADAYYYDDVVATYDLSELKDKSSDDVSYNYAAVGNYSSTSDNILGYVSGKGNSGAKNISLKFNLHIGTTLTKNHTFNVFCTGNYSAGSASNGGYQIYFVNNGVDRIRLRAFTDGTSTGAELYDSGDGVKNGYFKAGDLISVEITLVETYSDSEKTTRVGETISLKINGNLIASGLNTKAVTSKSTKIAKFFYDNASSDSTCYITSSYYFDDATDVDVYDLSNNRTRADITTTYLNSFGQIDKTENVNIKYSLKMPTTVSNVPGQGFVWSSLKQSFFTDTLANTNGNNKSEYTIYYYFQQTASDRGVRINTPSGTIYKTASNSLTLGETYAVAFTIRKVYSDAGKTVRAGRYIKLTANDSIVFSFIDYNGTSDITNTYIGAPAIDGQISEDGYAATTYATYEVSATVIAESATGNGTVLGGSVVEGHDCTVIVKPDAVSKVALFTVDGEDKTDLLEDDDENGNYKYTIESVTGNMEVAAKFDQKYFYNECTVYDIADINEDITKRFIDGNYDDTELLRLPKTSDIAIKFLLGVPTGLNWNLKQAILGTDGNSYSGNCAFYIYYRFEGAGKIGIEDHISDNARAFADVILEQGKEYSVEIGILSAYSDEERTQKIGNIIYLSIDGEKVLSYFDDDGVYGDHINVPIVDGNFKAESGYIRTAYGIHEVKIVDGEENVIYSKEIVDGRDFNATIEMARGEAVESFTLGGEDKTDLLTDEAAGISIFIEGVTGDSTFVLVKKSNVSVSVNVDLKDLEVVSAAPASVMIREPLTFSFILPEGERVKDVKNNGESIMQYCQVSNGVATVIIPCVYREVGIVVTTETVEYNLTVSGEGHGTVTASTYSPKANSSVIITAVIETGYEATYMFDYVKVNGKEIRLNPDGSYVISDVKGDITVQYSVVAIDDEDESTSQETQSDDENDSESVGDTESENKPESGSNPASGGCLSSVETKEFVCLSLFMLAAIIIIIGKKNEEKGTNR